MEFPIIAVELEFRPTACRYVDREAREVYLTLRRYNGLGKINHCPERVAEGRGSYRRPAGFAGVTDDDSYAVQMPRFSSNHGRPHAGLRYTVDCVSQFDRLTRSATPMNWISNLRRASLMLLMSLCSAHAIAAGGLGGASPRPDEGELLAAGFKVLVATTTVQQDWVKGLPPGKIRPMQRTGKKYFIYPDASKNQIYVGGPQEFEAYQRLHPEMRNEQSAQAAQSAADKASYLKQNKNMEAANSRDLSNPFLGASWNELLGR